MHVIFFEYFVFHEFRRSLYAIIVKCLQQGSIVVALCVCVCVVVVVVVVIVVIIVVVVVVFPSSLYTVFSSIEEISWDESRLLYDISHTFFIAPL